MKTLMCAMAMAAASASYGVASAQTLAQPAAPTVDVSQFNGAARDLPDAVSAIQSSGRGDVVDIRFHAVNGAPGYDVVVANGAAVEFMRFSRPTPGLVALSTAMVPRWMLQYRQEKNVSLARKAPVSLDTAIRTAEQANGGAPAVAAGIAVSAANPNSNVHAYNVLLKTSGGVQRVAVDSETGVIIANPRALRAWP